MSDYVDPDMQLAGLHDEELEITGQATMYDEVMQEPWMNDFFDWEGYEAEGQGAAALPDDRPSTFDEAILIMDASGARTAPSRFDNYSPSDDDSPEGVLLPPVLQPSLVAPTKKTIACDVQGCKLKKTFGRNAELRRHVMLKHNDLSIRYPCPAIGCDRTGKRGFIRKDKLKDHMLQGHSNDTDFVCPTDGCGLVLPRLPMTVHCGASWGHPIKRKLGKLVGYRDCPMPKCPFRCYTRSSKKGHSLDGLQHHLIEAHGREGRDNFANLIRDRGYDPMTGDIVCPVCTGSESRFQGHTEFYLHFIKNHLGLAEVDPRVDTNKEFCEKFFIRDGGYAWATYLQFQKSFVAYDEVRQHRRTILSLWPDFANFRAVWADIKQCPQPQGA